MPGKHVRLAPRGRLLTSTTLRPALCQIVQVRQCHPKASLIEHGKPSCPRPQHKSGSPIGALKRRPFVAGGLVKMLLVGLQPVEASGRAKFPFLKWQGIDCGLAAIGPSPVRYGQRTLDDLANVEVVVVLLLIVIISGTMPPA